MNKVIAKMGAGVATLMTALAPYTVDSTQASELGNVASDVADSIIQNVTSILPVMIPVIVIGFIIKFIRSMINKR